MKFGDIYLVNFDPSTGHEYQSKRPALIIQTDEQLCQSNMVTIMPLTSKTNNSHGDDIELVADSGNRLYRNSLIKVHHINSFDRTRFLYQIGHADESTMGKVGEYLKKHFGV